VYNHDLAEILKKFKGEGGCDNQEGLEKNIKELRETITIAKDIIDQSVLLLGQYTEKLHKIILKKENRL